MLLLKKIVFLISSLKCLVKFRNLNSVIVTLLDCFYRIKETYSDKFVLSLIALTKTHNLIYDSYSHLDYHGHLFWNFDCYLSDCGSEGLRKSGFLFSESKFEVVYGGFWDDWGSTFRSDVYFCSRRGRFTQRRAVQILSVCVGECHWFFDYCEDSIASILPT